MRRTALRAITATYLVIALSLLWYFSSNSSRSPFFPPLRTSLHAFAHTWTSAALTHDLLPSLLKFLTGFVIAVSVGVCFGLILGLAPRARRDLSIILEFARATPIAALVPVALIVFGPGAKMETVLIAFGCVWPILIGAMDGSRSVDSAMIEMGRSFGISGWSRVRHISVPAAMPQIFAGARISLAIGLQIMVFANMFAGSSGIGFFVKSAQDTFDIPSMWAGIFAIGCVGVILTTTFAAVEHRALAWHRGWRMTEGRG